ncbi:mannitol dehydrogenase family protein [Prauserella cavernicola]|uniref:Mannitol-1-phosphate 5-dehydrogenase n=1 Tax=Prauserella cavernicola TaxID=2800127 RepID=A0A934QWH7_9PSEU|nr:mannitol dehydrogenase family protein [Prauserella cavernicola]MBK1787905.1 mannitol dehydrogenase family protein [Prauserella cavernicola]
MTNNGGVHTPTYDRADVSPGILHFGVGNFHRSHQAAYLDRLLRQGQASDWGIIGVGLLPRDAQLGEILHAQDFTYTLVELGGDGRRTATRISSIIDFVHAPAEPERVREHLVSPEIRIVSLTITEGGYNTSDVTGEFDTSNPDILADVGAQHPRTVFGILAEGLHLRRGKGLAPFTVVSCDNVPGNGGVIRRALVAFARLAYDDEFADWIDASVSFPDSMVDRITPVTTDAERALVRDDFGIDDAWPVVCEPFTQWVLEDDFTLGRPPWEDAGVQLVEDVAPYELMKIRLLNGSHQAIAHAGILRGHTYVHEAMADAEIVGLVRRYMVGEAAHTLHPVPGIDLTQYMDQLLERFANPNIRDTLTRLATDASDRLPKFLVPVATQLSQAGEPAPASASVLAAWAVRSGRDLHAGRTLNDRQAERLEAALRGTDADPAGFLANSDWFDNLIDDPRFTVDFRHAHQEYSHV